MSPERTSFRLGPGDDFVLDEIQRLCPDCANRSDAIRFCIRIAGEHFGIKILDCISGLTPDNEDQLGDGQVGPE